MKISLEWLSDFLPGPIDANAAAEILTHGGFPVEAIDLHTDEVIVEGNTCSLEQRIVTVLDVEVTSNRGDCLSHIGVARELSALMGRAFTQPNEAGVADGAPSVASVKIEAHELCPHYIAQVIEGVKIAPSPAWLRRRLEAVGLRPINNVVDATNYVMFELGQPLHAFDFDRLAEKRIVVRRAKKGETLVSIDGHERKLVEDMLVIADGVKPVALAGVMGGRESEVSEQTVNVLLESARFDPLSVRKTARALQMRSDSSYRFERGIDPTLPARASDRAAQLIIEIAGGKLAGGKTQAGASGDSPKKLTLRLRRLQQILGVELPAEQVVDALQRLHLSPVRQGDAIDVTVPSHRLDLNIEVDLVEEAARVIGYDKVPLRDEISIRLQPEDPKKQIIETIRSTLVASGYFEAVTVSFVSDSLAADFVPAGANAKSPLPKTEATVRKVDAALRPSILPGLLESVRHNETSGTAGAKLFEIGATFFNDAGGQLIERRKVAWVGSNDVREGRGVVEKLLNRLDANRPVQVIPDSAPGFAKSACGRIEWGGMPIGYLGKIDRSLTDKLSLRDIPAAVELDLQPLLSGAQLVPQLKPLAKFPAVRRDVSFILPEAVRFEALQSLVAKAEPAQMEDMEYVTTYRGKPLEKGLKSVTITLVFRSATETLTGENVEAAVQKVVSAAKEQLGATLRT